MRIQSLQGQTIGLVCGEHGICTSTSQPYTSVGGGCDSDVFAVNVCNQQVAAAVHYPFGACVCHGRDVGVIVVVLVHGQIDGGGGGDSGNSGPGKLPGGAIAGIVIAVLIVIGAVVGVLVFFLVVRKRREHLMGDQCNVDA